MNVVIDELFNKAAQAKDELLRQEKNLKSLHREAEELQKPPSLKDRIFQFGKPTKRNDLEQKRQEIEQAERELRKNLEAYMAMEKELKKRAEMAASEKRALSATQNEVVLMRPLQFRPRPGAQMQDA